MSKMSWQDRLSQGDPTLRVHLVGIGGAGLSAIAQVLLEMRVHVSGSDRQPGAVAQRLAAAGATVAFVQEAANLTQLPAPARPDVVLISSAIDAANPERRAAEELGIPIVKRDEFLPALLAERRLIAVAGAHGKTTTTAMTIQALRSGGVDCGYIVGTEVPNFGSGAAGTARDFVVEADEYDRMFLGLRPGIAVVTNVEWDHPDCYPTPASFRRAFMQFTDNVDRDGMIVSCADDAGAEQVRAYAANARPALDHVRPGRTRRPACRQPARAAQRGDARRSGVVACPGRRVGAARARGAQRAQRVGGPGRRHGA